MIKIKLTGGLGNQMFQYAIGLAVAIKNDTSLVLDVSHYKAQSSKDTPRDFGLSVLNISQREISEISESVVTKIVKKIKNRIFPVNPYSFYPKVFSSKNLEGVFQNEKYFIEIRDILLKEYTLTTESEKFKESKKYIKNIESVALHIRRGDYVTNPLANAYHRVLDLTYFKTAYEEIVTKIGKDFTLLIYTDDIQWAEQNITFHDQTQVMSKLAFGPSEEILLMSYSNHIIISNSSYSWWSAWLNQNPNKIVISPHKWTAKNVECDIIPSTWIKI